MDGSGSADALSLLATGDGGMLAPVIGALLLRAGLLLLVASGRGRTLVAC